MEHTVYISQMAWSWLFFFSPFRVGVLAVQVDTGGQGLALANYFIAPASPGPEPCSQVNKYLLTDNRGRLGSM